MSACIVLMYRLLRQSIKGLLTLLCCEKYHLPPDCHTYHKIISILEIITLGEFIKMIYLYYRRRARSCTICQRTWEQSTRKTLDHTLLGK